MHLRPARRWADCLSDLRQLSRVVASANTMGRFPDPRYQENTKNENTEVFVTEGEIPEPGEVPAQEQEPSKTNAVQEQQCEKVVKGRIVPPRK